MLASMRTASAVWVAIAVGSAVGGVARHALTEAVGRIAGTGWPWGTWVVNVTGSAAIGALTAMAAAGWPVAWSAAARQAAITGVLGGFTTFSAFSVQTLALLQQGQWLAAAAYAGTSVAVGVASCWLAFAAVLAAVR